MDKRLTALIHGRVQNVAFRHYTQQEALRLELTGWVTNRPDGSVKVVAEGSEGKLHQLERWLHHGPSAARVDSVDAMWSEGTGEFRSFRIRH